MTSFPWGCPLRLPALIIRRLGSGRRPIGAQMTVVNEVSEDVLRRFAEVEAGTER
jgi:hypothetical protein